MNNFDFSDNKSSFWHDFDVTRVVYTIDKGYRIFFRTWGDTCPFEIHDKILVNVAILHRDPPIGWRDSINVVPTFAVSRYGLRLSEEDLRWGESIIKNSMRVKNSKA